VLSTQQNGVVDALFLFLRPVTGGYYWCPPTRGNRVDLRILGL
jgi:porphyrinogen peroxidase